MSETLAADLSPAAAEFVAAMTAGKHDLADSLLPRMTGPLPAQVLRLVTDLHFRRSRWSEAAAAAERYPADDTGAALKRNLARNLAALRAHRPEVYQAVLTAMGGGQYLPIPGDDGGVTIGRRKADGSVDSLSQANRPKAALGSIVEALRPAMEKGAALALCSVADGYLMQWLAKNPPKLFMDQEQAIYVIEPDAAQVAAVMLIHDCSGPTGPIEQKRFEWFVGKDWSRRLREAFTSDLTHLFPALNVTSGPAGASVDAELKGLLRDLNLLDARLAEQVRAYYARVTKGDLAAVMSDAPPRRPRVLLLTTRFSTVLQYSTADTADGFRQLGWDARVLIEPGPYRGLTGLAVRQAIAEFKPDLFFQLDHLRHEHGPTIPPELPFVCWVQDHLPNLTDRRAGATVGVRDFVLTPLRSMYRDRYGYPARQLVDVSKLTRVPVRPATWTSREPDIAYVSNASQLPAALAASVVAAYTAGSAGARLAQACCDALSNAYAAGRSFPTHHSLIPLIRETAEAVGIAVTELPDEAKFLDLLFERPNNALYRQQALGWAADAADKFGLTLALYGNGWEQHLRFAKYARGPVKYGAELERLTRDAKVNLQVVPYFCLHQRLLDGLVAGGFFLVRGHPADRAMTDLARFLAAHAPEAETAEEVRQVIPGDLRDSFDDLLRRNEFCQQIGGDAVGVVRGCMRSGILAPQDEALPRLAETTFDSPAEFEARLLRFINDPALRAAVAAGQREDVESRLSYEAGMRRVVARVRGLIESEPAAG